MKLILERKRQIVPYLFLTAFTCFVCWYFVGRHGMFASTVDWISQHSVIPDYFRRQFYQTKELFPEFAAGIGGGQNIYHFAYYGLYHPMILFSYFLPFVKMSDYMIAISFLGVLASVLLLFYWLKSHRFSMEINIFVSMLFVLAGPVVFHSCRQVMFVNYMPFLCLSLIGVDRYWKSGKRGIYTAGIFLMILTSFYFSIGGILAVFLYGMSRYRKTEWNFPIIRFGFPIAAAVCSSAVLLIPTGLALMTRSGSSKSFQWKELFIPDFSVSRFAYNGYGIGLTAGILVVLFVGMTYKCRRTQILSAGCLILLLFPVFAWILNGGLYVRNKALIPFLPVLLFLSAVFLQKIKQKEIPLFTCVGGIFLSVFFCFISLCLHAGSIESKETYFLLCEFVLSFLFFLLYIKFRYTVFLILPSFLCLILSGTDMNRSDEVIMDKQFYGHVTDFAWQKEISKLFENEKGLYRMEQGGAFEEKKANINRIWDIRQWSSSLYSSIEGDVYNTFREEVFGVEQPFRNKLMQGTSDNPLFLKFMGVKYLLWQKENEDTFDISVQEHAAPILYATDKIMSEKTYHNLSFPYNQTALMQFAVAKDTEDLTDAGQEKTLYPVNPADVFVAEKEGIEKTDNGYHIQAKKETGTELTVMEKEPVTKEDRLLFVQFDVKNKKESQDVYVDLAGERNKLTAKSHIYYNENTTFTYAVLLKEADASVKLSFSAGDYEISNLCSYIGSRQILEADSLYQSKFVPDLKNTQGNRICGKIKVKNDGYLVTSIPYDKGFEIWIDGVRVKAQKVNTAFLGADITKGEHQIDIVYHANGVLMGKWISVFGVLLWGILLSDDRKKALLPIYTNHLEFQPFYFTWNCNWKRSCVRIKKKIQDSKIVHTYFRKILYNKRSL